MKVICLDPGHGMSNKKHLVFDPGAVFGSITEESVAMKYANELRDILRQRGCKVVRTRVDDRDPAPVGRRDDIAVAYGCEVMVSIHCNSGGSTRGGTETFYRGSEDKAFAERLNAAVCAALGTVNRGAKTEKESQHPSLAVLDFPNCWLLELGFLDHTGDRAKLLDDGLRRKACEAIAEILIN